jgi:hypothetical protein
VAGAPVRVRNHDSANLQTTGAPYMRSDLPVAGFAVIDAADLEKARLTVWSRSGLSSRCPEQGV